LGIWT